MTHISIRMVRSFNWLANKVNSFQGEALHRFLQILKLLPPVICISCRGTRGKVTEFDFCIDITPDAFCCSLVCPDDEPAIVVVWYASLKVHGQGRPNIKAADIKLHKEWGNIERFWVCRLGSAGWITPILMPVDPVHTLTA